MQRKKISVGSLFAGIKWVVEKQERATTREREKERETP
jgi:hypothetical protein